MMSRLRAWHRGPTRAASLVPWSRAAASVVVAAVAVAVLVPGVAGAAENATSPPRPAQPTGDAAVDDEVGPLGDPYRPQQWYLDQIGLAEDRPAPTGAGHVVAIVDSGVDLEHPDLAPVLARRPDGSVLGRDFVDGDDVPQDEFGHGTMVAGIVAAAAGNGVGTRGVAPGAAIMPLRVLDAEGVGDTSGIAEAIDFAVAEGAAVVNLSLEAATEIAVDDVAAVVAAIRRAVDGGVAVVAAAGNHGEPLEDFAPDLGVVVVGATDREDRRAGFSDGGRSDLLMAPGVEIVSSWCREPEQAVCDGSVHNQGMADGTSFAAPQVAGAIALLLEAGLDAEEAVGRILATAVDLGPVGPDPGTGVGRVDVAAALGPWPDGPVPAGPTEPVAPTETPTAAPVPADATPEAIEVAEAPTSTRAVFWIVVAVVSMVIVVVGRGLVVERRVRPTGTMPDLRGSNRPAT